MLKKDDKLKLKTIFSTCFPLGINMVREIYVIGQRMHENIAFREFRWHFCSR